MTLKALIENLSFQTGDALERTVWLLLGRGKSGIKVVAGALTDGRISADMHRFLSGNPDRLLELLLTVPEKSWDASVKALLRIVPPATLAAKGRELWSQGEAAQGHALLAMVDGEEETGLDADPDSFCRLGDSLRVTEQWGKAEDAYRRGLMVKGDHAGLISGLSRVWLHWIRSGARDELVASLAALERADLVRDVVFHVIRWARQEAWEDLDRLGGDLRDFGRRLERMRELTEEAIHATESLPAIRDRLVGEATAGHDLALELTRFLQGYEPAEVRLAELEVLVREAAALASASDSKRSDRVGSNGKAGLSLAGDPVRVMADPHLTATALGNVLAGLLAARKVRPMAVTWGETASGAEIVVSWEKDHHSPVKEDPVDPAVLGRVRQMLWKQGAEISLEANRLRIVWPPLDEVRDEVLSERRRLARILAESTQKGQPAGILPEIRSEDFYGVVSEAVTIVTDQALGDTAEILSFGVHDLKNGFVFAGNWAEQLGDPATPRGLVIERISNLLAKMERWLSDLQAYLELNEEPTLGYHKITDVVEEALRTVSATFQKAGVRVYRELPHQSPHVRGDRNRLVSALANLFLNSAEAMSDGGLLRVEMSRTEPAGDRPEIEIAITDSGPGLTPERLAYLTGGTAERAGGGGRGIGLAAVRRVVSEHGGILRIAAGDGRGTRIAITLPIVDTDQGLRAAVEGFDNLDEETKKALRAAEGFLTDQDNLPMAGFLTLKAVEMELQTRVLDKVERHRILPTALALQQVTRTPPKSLDRALSLPGVSVCPWGLERLTAVLEAIARDRLAKALSDWRNVGLLLWVFGRVSAAGGVLIQNPLSLGGLSERDLGNLCQGLAELEGHRGQVGSVTSEQIARSRETAVTVLEKLSLLWVGV